MEHMKRNRSIFAAMAILAAFIAAAAPAYASGLKQSVEITGGSLSSLPDATCNATTAVIVPADSAQVSAILTNIGSNPARIGDANCGASQCALLAAGATLQINTTAAISCFSASGSTIAISKVEQ
jgi:hypothetical protein